MRMAWRMTVLIGMLALQCGQGMASDFFMVSVFPWGVEYICCVVRF